MSSAPILKNALWLVLSLLIVLLDQWSKQSASSALDYGRALELAPWLNFTLMHNEGAAFSFLSSAGGWQRWLFVAISSLVSLVIALWLLRLKANEKLMAVSLTFILGGALGNLWDRAVLGYVVDFISVHYHNRYFPTFNIADAAISVGAALMILDMFVNPEKSTAQRD
ncbi:MAG: signal peptidase II [Paraglaciecola psychrophila]